jgi:hypothetical protein
MRKTICRLFGLLLLIYGSRLQSIWILDVGQDPSELVDEEGSLGSFALFHALYRMLSTHSYSLCIFLPLQTFESNCHSS